MSFCCGKYVEPVAPHNHSQMWIESRHYDFLRLEVHSYHWGKILSHREANVLWVCTWATVIYTAVINDFVLIMELVLSLDCLGDKETADPEVQSADGTTVFGPFGKKYLKYCTHTCLHSCIVAYVIGFANKDYRGIFTVISGWDINRMVKRAKPGNFRYPYCFRFF